MIPFSTAVTETNANVASENTREITALGLLFDTFISNSIYKGLYTVSFNLPAGYKPANVTTVMDSYTASGYSVASTAHQPPLDVHNRLPIVVTVSWGT